MIAPFAVALASVAAAAFAVGNNSLLAAVLALGLVLAGTEVHLLNRAAGGFTAANFPVISVNVTLLLGMVAWPRVSESAYVSAILPNDTNFLITSAVIGIGFCAAYTAGALLAGPRKVEISAKQLGNAVSQFKQSFKVPSVALLIVGYAGLLQMIYAWQDTIIQGRYNVHNGPTWAISLSSITLPLALIALALASIKPGLTRVLALFGLGAFFILLFALAKRAIVLIPLMLLVTQTFLSGRRVRAAPVALAGAAAILLLEAPLVGRSNPDGVGLVPLGRKLFAQPEAFFPGFDLGGLVGNVLFSAPLTAAVAEKQIPSSAFWASVNPMPGGASGWANVALSQRINFYTPYNSLGELAAQGWFALLVSAGAAGFILAMSTRIASNQSGNFRLAATLLVAAIIAFFSLSILQYNLRSSARLVWYTLSSVTALWLTSLVLRNGPKILLQSDDKRGRSYELGLEDQDSRHKQKPSVRDTNVGQPPSH